MLQVCSLRITSLRNFASDGRHVFNEDAQFVMIEGPNGSGKTTLLEAVYYACHLKSFRTSHSLDLVAFGQDHFFIEVGITDSYLLQRHTISVGCDGERKVVKLDGKAIKTHKDVLQILRVIGVTEGDIDLIRGAPQLRRTFLGQTQILLDPTFVERMRTYRRTVNQRNALLFGFKRGGGSLSLQQLHQLNVWTRTLWEASIIEIKHFNELLSRLNIVANDLLTKYCLLDNLSVSLKYEPAHIDVSESFDDFWDRYKDTIMHLEVTQGRGTWGLHLDDFEVDLTEKSMRRFASRGQQKLAILLLKIAVTHLVGRGNAIMLIDDFITDFDAKRVQQVLEILRDSGCQIIMTTPFAVRFPTDWTPNFQHIKLGEVLDVQLVCE
jgi:DNA replication and repair protein RecF